MPNENDIWRIENVFPFVYLTKNSRSRYVIQELEDYERKEAVIKLMTELEKGRNSGENEEWFTLEEIRKEFNIAEHYLHQK